MNNQNYDAIILGAGVGGCSTAYGLCSAGKNVLIIEKGSKFLDINQNIDQTIHFTNHNKKSSIKMVPLAEGLGGNSQIFGAQLSRFDKTCFQTKASGTGLFPFKYTEINQYYEEIEALFYTNEPQLSLSEKKLLTNFEACGFDQLKFIHAIGFVDGCDGCGGKFCKYKCKKDFFSVLCNDFVKSGKLTVVDGASISSIEIDKKHFKSLNYINNGGKTKVSANSLIFSAGALKTPCLIKEFIGPSLNKNVKKKIGNGLVFHISDFYLLYPKFIIKNATKKIKILNGRHKQSQYNMKHLKYTVQSTGVPITKEYIQSFIFRRLNNKIKYLTVIKFIISNFSLLAERMGAKFHVVATIIQDPVLDQNKLIIDKNTKKSKIFYALGLEFNSLINKVDAQLRKSLKKRFFVFRLGGKANINYGHPMGGCAMGEGKNYPINKNGLLKSTNNIYIADASVFPISGDTNPSLTIAAVALRTAKHISRVG
jgi:hypothetical protein